MTARTHDFVGDRHRAVQPRPRLPGRADRGPRRRVPRPHAGVRLAPGDAARGAARCRRRSWPTSSRSPTRPRRTRSSTTPRSRATSTRSTSARASTRCAASSTTTAAGRPRSWATCASGATVHAVEHDGDAYVVHATRRGRDLPRPPPRARDRHAAARALPELRGPRSCTAPATCRPTRRSAGSAAASRSSAAARARPRSSTTCSRTIDQHDYELTWITRSAALLPARVHEADARDDLAGVHGVLPPAPAAGARRPRRLAGPAVQGHRRRR